MKELAASSYELAAQKANKIVEIHPSKLRISSASKVQTILAALQVGPAEESTHVKSDGRNRVSSSVQA